VKDRDGNEWVLVPRSTLEYILEYWNGNQNERAMVDALEHILETVQEAIAAAPQFVVGEVTRPMCHGAWAQYWSEPNNGDSCGQAMRWLEAWRAELGPTLGLVEIREPTPEECERIYRHWEQRATGLCRTGRDAFDAVRAVMWPKSEAK